MQVSIKLSEQEILRHISLYGPKTGYQLGKETKYSQKTSYKGVKNLMDKGLLSVSIVGKTRAGMDKKEYSLTVLGLIHALTIIRPEEWQPIMKTWSDLIPFVTDKWDIFVNAGVEDLAMRRLKTATREIFVWKLINIFTAATDLICFAEIFSARFYHSKIGTYSSEDRLRWAEVCRNNPEIHEYFTKSVKMNILSHAAEIVEAEKILDILEDNEDKGKRKPILSKDFMMRRLTRRDDEKSILLSWIDHFFHSAGPSPP